MRSRAPRILFLDGCGDLIGAYRHWRAGEPDPNQTDATFSGQFFDIATRIGAHVRAIAWPGDQSRVEEGRFVIEHRRRPFPSARGAAYHVAQVLWAADIASVAIRAGVDVIVMQDGPYRWLLAPLRALGVHLVAVVHNTLWPACHPPVSLGKRALATAEGWFFRRVSDATLAVSPECERQVRTAAIGRPRGSVAQFRPTYDGPLAAAPRSTPATPFRVLYAGRLERDKGVFDLLEVAARLEASRPGGFRWTICGGGSAEREFATAAQARGLASIVTLRGRLRRPELSAEFAGCDSVFVPTTAGFPEGLNRAAVEAALSGRPVVISKTAPAAEILGPAAVVVAPGDIEAYAAALRLLADDAALYGSSCEAAVRASAALLDPNMSLQTVLGRVLDNLFVPTQAGPDAARVHAERRRSP
jgi:glycogen synthase